MPVKDLDDFKSQYYSIISEIAQQAKLGDFDIEEGDFFVGEGDYGKERGELQTLKNSAGEKGIDVSEFRFDLGNPLLDEPNLEIFKFFSNIDSGEPYGDGVSSLDIPDTNKKEIQAQGFVNAFDKMKEKGSDPTEFQKYYKNVQSLSRRLDLHEVENPELRQNLEKSNGIFNNFNRVYNKTHGKSSDVFGDISEIEAPNKEGIGEMLGKAEEAYELQQELRLELAKHIALNKIPVFGENGEVSEKIDDLEVGNIFKGKALNEGISDYLNKNCKDLITGQDEIVKLNKVFHALGIDGQNMDNFKKLIAQEKAKIDTKSVKTDQQKVQQPTVETVSDSPKSQAKPTLNTVKEQMARNILAVAKVNPTVIDKIMNNPEMAKAKEAIMKRADNALTNLGVDTKNEFGLTTKLASIKDDALQNQVEAQSKGLIAQVGRVSSWSIDGQDMRGKENLHEKYQDKASKLDKGTFDKNVVEALEYENSKDGRGKLETFAYNTFFRKPLQLLDAMRPVDDKPFFTPGKTALVGLVALAVLAPPLGAIVCGFLMCKAAKNQFYDGSKLQSWVDEKFFKSPEKESIVDKGALEKVNVKSLLPEKDKGKEVVQEKDMSLDKTVTKEKDTSIDQGQKLVQEKDTQKPKDNLQEMIDANPTLKKEFEKVVSTAIKSNQQREEVINLTKEMAGKDKDGKQRSMDDLDLMSAKSRIEANKRKRSSMEI
ncbi:hypothetical protein N3Z17_03680 [Candidatus Bandiella numerosa]|uniref:hypothetical protein n=1 Tax=Candidatus Bandiella numerosa TaxID=2570586 RepID=UPI00249F7EDC|nr:hypothetical protein [Candidatus Bandiella numerosa]WHA04332.1 hypothetical protein N3Z17_03680 [Candidatus Bandiella numerosa]